MSNTAVFGVYRDTVSLSAGLEALRAAGFRNTDISVLLPENAGTKDFVHQKDTKAPEGATTGATTGAVLGGIVGWLVGIGALAIPGLGPLIAAGPSWPSSPVPVRWEPRVASSERWSASEFPNMKPSASKAACVRAGRCSPSIATIPSG